MMVPNVRIVIYSNDHPPPHVHAIGRGGARVRSELNCPDGPVTLLDQFGFRTADIWGFGTAIATDHPVACEKWRAIHG